MSEAEPPGKDRRRGCWAGCLALIALPVLGVVSWAILDAHPSDAQMAREFAAGRPQMEELVAMMRSEPKLTHIGPRFFWSVPMPGLSDARKKRYWALFDQLHLEAGAIRNPDGSVVLLRSHYGTMLIGYGKAFLWSAKDQPSALPADSGVPVEKRCENSDYCRSYKRLAPGWFILFDTD
jgi:hypothetical protein